MLNQLVNCCWFVFEIAFQLPCYQCWESSFSNGICSVPRLFSEIITRSRSSFFIQKRNLLQIQFFHKNYSFHFSFLFCYQVILEFVIFIIIINYIIKYYLIINIIKHYIHFNIDFDIQLQETLIFVLVSQKKTFCSFLSFV